MRSLATASALLALATATAGCAVIGAKAPDPDRPRDQPPMCNDGKGGVVVDGLMTTVLGFITIGAASNGAGEAAAITGLGALAYGISAGAGNASANKCRAAMDEFVAMREAQEAETAFARGSGAPGGGVEMVGGIPVVAEDEDEPGARMPPPAPRPQPQPQPHPQVQPQPQPQPSIVAPKPAPRPSPAASRGDDEGDWSEFWKEVP